MSTPAGGRSVAGPVAEELEWASAWLDAHPELRDEVAADLGAETGASRGRHGLTCETILRCAVLKHLRQETCRGLEFTLRDSRSAQRFARVDAARLPRKSALQATMGAVRATTWERINRRLLSVARDEGVESGERVRIDSTVTATHILEPADSRLLYDGIRVLTRLLGTARDRLGADAVVFHNHRRAAKRRALEIQSQRGAQRRAKTYRKLLRLVTRTRGYVEHALPVVAATDAPWAGPWQKKVRACNDLLERVVDQTQRRVFGGETVPAQEKVVSLFEPHTDIIVKGGRGTHYGHKVNFATGRSGLALDVVVEDGNPADSARCLPMLARHVEHYGAAPTHAAFDGGSSPDSKGDRIVRATERLIDSWPTSAADDAWRVSLRVSRMGAEGSAGWSTTTLNRRISRAVPSERLQAKLDAAMSQWRSLIASGCIKSLLRRPACA